MRKLSLTYRCTAGDSSAAIEEFILMDYYGGVPATEKKKKKELKYKKKVNSLAHKSLINL